MKKARGNFLLLQMSNLLTAQRDSAPSLGFPTKDLGNGHRSPHLMRTTMLDQRSGEIIGEKGDM